MRVKLNVLSFGECAQVFVYAEPHEESFHNWRVFKIWHNRKSSSMTPVFLPLHYINDHCVSFSSKVPFNLFCERFENSPYAKAENYHFLTHNCSNAALYALQLADIQIPVSQLTLMRIPFFSLPIPGPFLSPLDVFYRSKNHKIQLLKNAALPLQKMDFKLELATSKLHFWAKSTQNQTLTKNVQTVVSEVKKGISTDKHNSELYLAALIKTIDLIFHENSKKSREDYSNYLRQFKKRESTSHREKATTQYMLFSKVMIPLSIILYIADIDDWKINSSFYLSTAFFMARILKAARTDINLGAPLYRVKDTQLSLAMENVNVQAETDFRPI